MCVLGWIFFFLSEGRWVGRYWKLIWHTAAANDITGAGRPAGYFSLIFFFHTVWITDVSFIFYACQWLKHAGTDKKQKSLDNTQWKKKTKQKNNRSFSPTLHFQHNQSYQRKRVSKRTVAIISVKPNKNCQMQRGAETMDNYYYNCSTSVTVNQTVQCSHQAVILHLTSNSSFWMNRKSPLSASVYSQRNR